MIRIAGRPVVFIFLGLVSGFGFTPWPLQAKPHAFKDASRCPGLLGAWKSDPESVFVFSGASGRLNGKTRSGGARGALNGLRVMAASLSGRIAASPRRPRFRWRSTSAQEKARGRVWQTWQSPFFGPRALNRSGWEGHVNLGHLRRLPKAPPSCLSGYSPWYARCSAVSPQARLSLRCLV
jgi:hypothetical protein